MHSNRASGADPKDCKAWATDSNHCRRLANAVAETINASSRIATTAVRSMEGDDFVLASFLFSVLSARGMTRSQTKAHSKERLLTWLVQRRVVGGRTKLAGCWASS